MESFFESRLPYLPIKGIPENVSFFTRLLVVLNFGMSSTIASKITDID